MLSNSFPCLVTSRLLDGFGEMSLNVFGIEAILRFAPGNGLSRAREGDDHCFLGLIQAGYTVTISAIADLVIAQPRCARPVLLACSMGESRTAR